VVAHTEGEAMSKEAREMPDQRKEPTRSEMLVRKWKDGLSDEEARQRFEEVASQEPADAHDREQLHKLKERWFRKQEEG